MRWMTIKRIIRAFVTMTAVLVFVFIGARVTGDPFTVMFPDGITNETLAEFNRQYGLDQPFHVQFIRYISGVLRGDFGISIAERRPVTEIYAGDIVRTLQLGFWALLVSITCGLGLGAICAAWPKNTISKILMLFIGAAYSIPGFIIAIFLILLFSFHLKILPSMANDTPVAMIMPVIALSAHPIAAIARYVRSGYLDVINQDFIRTARAKGLGMTRVRFNHALRNAMIPVITIIGILVTDIVSGSIIIETVFSWPGVGKRLVGAVLERDFPVLQFGVVWFSFVVILTNLIVDLLYSYIDPRIRVEA